MKKKALLLILVLMFISSNALSQNWIQGQITGDIQEGITVNLYKTSCGGDDVWVWFSQSNSEGYYGFGNLDNGGYRVVPDNASYFFNLEFDNVIIPQIDLQSYDFTSTYNCEIGDRFFDNFDGTVTDCRTDRVWLKDANCYGGQYWDDAMSSAAGLNSGECGLTDGSVEGDWNLANKEELQGIGTDPPSTYTGVLPEGIWTTPGSPFVNVPSNPHWSSTEYDTDYAWYVYMGNGDAYYWEEDIHMFSVWPVRKLTCDDVDRFLDNNDGTVKDCRTGLLWLKNADCYGTQAWATAKTSVEGLSSGDCELTDGSANGDWHLATKGELQGIGTDPLTTWTSGMSSVTWTEPGTPFVGVHSHYYWSSTEYSTNGAWVVDVYSGGVSIGNKDYSVGYVWPVCSDN